MKRITFGFILLFLVGSMFGQNTEKFKPSGKLGVKIYSDYHAKFSNGGSSSAFEVTRAYFGYGYKISKYWSAAVKLDVGNPGVGGLQMTAYLKTAQVQYKKGGFKTQFGLIGTTAFNMMEGAWGNRYLYKSFQDQNGFNPSADLGALVSYQFAPFISADFSVFNGEGYKHLQADSTFKYAFGVTLTPAKGLSLRAYYDYMNKNAAQQTFSVFANYKASGVNLGAEYSQQSNHGMVEGKNYSGVSFWAEYQMKKVKIFGRFDHINSVTLTGQTMGWNYKKDGQTIVAGVEIAPVKGVKISPNLQVWTPKDSSQHSMTGAFLSTEIKF